ncbi:MAG: T9SS type A sorting domain-containing protein [Bacteroidales bacterium]|nr:T9SS type A sorting domain-containing protein [Bacteroidales bacterium]
MSTNNGINVKGIVFILAFATVFGFHSVLQSQEWKEFQKVVAEGGSSGDYFATSLSVYGGTAVIGSPYDAGSFTNTGSACVFAFDGTTWNLVTKLTASNLVKNAYFGWDVDISGTKIIVGARGQDAISNNEGSAYIFEYINNCWVETMQLKASDGYPGEFFGWTVLINGDDHVIVAAPRDNYSFYYASGSLYIYEKVNTNYWIEKMKYLPDEPFNDKQFGFSIALCESYVIVGAQKGHLGVYIYHNLVAALSLQQKITGYDVSSADGFGRSVAINEKYAFIGAPFHGTQMQGSVIIYRETLGTWTYVCTITAPDPSDEKYFGHSLSVNNDLLVVGAYGDDENGDKSGSVYLYGFNGNNWEYLEKIIPSDVAEKDNFGLDVAAADHFVLAGSPQDDQNGSNSGSAYFFKDCTTFNYGDTSICQGDSIILGGAYRKEAGAYTDTLVNSVGCDSLIVTELTVDSTYLFYESVTVCQGDSYLWQDTIITNTGIYSKIYETTNGCDSIFELALEITEVDTSVTITGSALVANAGNASFQWIDCSVQQAIEGETGFEFIPAEPGIYAVEVTQNNCTDTSSCHSYIPGSIYDMESPAGIVICPNPADELLTITFAYPPVKTRITIYSIAGEIEFDMEYRYRKSIGIHLDSFQSGIYLVKVETGEKSFVNKILIR